MKTKTSLLLILSTLFTLVIIANVRVCTGSYEYAEDVVCGETLANKLINYE